MVALDPTRALDPKAWEIPARDTQRLRRRVHDTSDNGVVLDRQSGRGGNSLGRSRAWWSSPEIEVTGFKVGCESETLGHVSARGRFGRQSLACDLL